MSNPISETIEKAVRGMIADPKKAHDGELKTYGSGEKKVQYDEAFFWYGDRGIWSVFRKYDEATSTRKYTLSHHSEQDLISEIAKHRVDGKWERSVHFPESELEDGNDLLAQLYKVGAGAAAGIWEAIEEIKGMPKPQDKDSTEGFVDAAMEALENDQD
jgi:hypothetical protein